MAVKNKRNLFEELKQGLEEVKAHRKKKVSLRTYVIEKPVKNEVAQGK